MTNEDSAELEKYERQLGRREFVARNADVLVGLAFLVLAGVIIWVLAL